MRRNDFITKEASDDPDLERVIMTKIQFKVIFDVAKVVLLAGKDRETVNRVMGGMDLTLR